MKVLLYEQNAKMQKRSGIGRALRHQKKALELNGIDSTFNTRDKYDFVHINSSFAHTYRFVRKLQKRNVPVVIHGHSTYEDFRESFRLWRFIEPWFDRNLTRLYGIADYIITPTPYSKNLIENYSCTKCPVEAISNGINLDDYTPSEEKVRKYKEFFNIQNNEKVVIGIGLLFKRKGLHDFIEVAKKMPNIKFIWFGSLQKILCTREINKAIRNKPSNVIMPGYIDGDVIKGALQGADLFFFPSYEETEGIVVLEALASKIPLLIRDIPVYEDWLEDCRDCYKAKNNEEFVDKINFILSNDNSYIIENGYKIAQKRDVKLIGEQLISVYKKVIDITERKRNYGKKNI